MTWRRFLMILAVGFALGPLPSAQIDPMEALLQDDPDFSGVAFIEQAEQHQYGVPRAPDDHAIWRSLRPAPGRRGDVA